MTSAPLIIRVTLDSETPNRMRLVFGDEVVSRRNFILVNEPNRSEYEVITKFCAPVVWSIVAHWVNPQAGIAGIQNLELSRHAITVVKADQHAFGWETILEQVLVAIQQAYPGRWIRFQVNHEETVNQLVDWVIELQRLKQELDLPVDRVSSNAWTIRA